ncbi:MULTISPECIES: MATE family efflux transporter [Clostridium]|uniref:MATE family efflux transporter n=1 Tax=Clostridium TaxID=1485 RepID=UPI000E4ACACE|nr:MULTISPECIES: MATE family efflux transporter [Clostridium]MBD9275817.1 MATE family efflux transporter [Clostridium sp.]MCC2170253.1 MATE family efflux transporter [Clostridium fessum]RHP42368.1 MATE family efflux transporter [Clostridium sp. AF32-7AC]RHQ68453.1 MATE family efflux transporter [Clostridium sp. AF24-2LB]
MDQTYMKEKPVVPLLLSMGIPVIISMIVGALYNIVDSIFVAMISEDAMTAVSLVYPIQNLAHAAGVGFGVGINAMVARRLGEGKTRMANQTASQGVFLSALHGMILTILGMAVIPYFLRMFTSDEVTISYGLTYFRNVFLFSTIDTMGMAYEKVYQSVGKMKISMAAVLIGCGVNIVLDPIFIFGLGPMPELGIRGAAWATGIGQTASLLFYLILNHVKPLNVEISLREMRPSKEICGGMYSVGIAATLNMALTSLLLTALNAILAPFSQVYILVLGVYYKLQALLYQGASGVVQGMRPLIGYNYGAGEQERVKKIFRAAFMIVGIIMTAGTLLGELVPDFLMGLFTQTPSTVEIGRTALRLISPGFVMSTVSVIASGAFEGLGMGLKSLKISLMRYAVIIIPIAFVLSRIIGPIGVWHAFWLAELITAVYAGASWKRTITVSL